MVQFFLRWEAIEAELHWIDVDGSLSDHRSTKNLVYPVLLFYKRHISLYSLYFEGEREGEGEGEGVRLIINVFQKTWAKGL